MNYDPDVEDVRSVLAGSAEPGSNEIDRLTAPPASDPSASITDTALDTAAMRARLLPVLDDQETLEEVVHTWAIEDWRALGPKEHGPAFEVGGFTWRVLLFPEGNNVDSVSLYLEASDDKCDKKKRKASEVDAPANAQEPGQEPGPEPGLEPDLVQEESDAEPEKAGVEDDDTEKWAVCAQFGFVVWNPAHPESYHMNLAQHRFNPDESDWGFTRFMEVRKLSMPMPDRPALLEHNQLNITAYVRVLKDPTGVLWHNFARYNSKKQTGFTGLRNQGATCYLNSLLQSLYFTKAFRQLVYKIPTENDVKDSVTLSLQRTFFLLGSSESPVGTLELTRSFGWDSAEAFTQHDVQELNRVLMDKLETKMKGTDVDGALNSIFVGQMKSYIKCINVDFESSRLEDYWDLQLNVKGMKGLQDSFRDYVQVETLQGENQYHATGFGLQDAKKGVVFQSFPPVLHLQLKRYEYDFMRDMMVKVNDRYEFPEEVDLRPYLDPEVGADMSQDWEYQLHGVLVHAGDVNVGHYYALIKPDQQGSWYRFDDDRVTKASLKEVLEENYGGEPAPIPSVVPPNNPMFRASNNNTHAGTNTSALNQARLNYKRHSSAYMLVYFRKSKLSDILSGGDDKIPGHIPRIIEQDAEEERARRKEREEQHFFMTCRVMTTRHFQQYHGFDLGIWDPKASPTTAAKLAMAGSGEDALADVFRIRKTITVQEFLDGLMTEYKLLPSQKIRLWTMVARQNKTYRLDSPVSALAPLTMEQLREKSHTRNTGDLNLWLEEVDGGDIGTQSSTLPEIGIEDASMAPPQTSRTTSRSLIFLKFFDPESQGLVGAGTVVVQESERLSALASLIAKRMAWPESSVRLIEEIKPEMVDVLDLSMTFVQSEISNGDIICFERILSDEQTALVKGYPTALEYYDFMLNRMLVTFKSHREIVGLDEGHSDPTFNLWVSRKATYEEFAGLVGDRLGVPSTHLQFCTTLSSGRERPPLRPASGSTLMNELVGFGQGVTNVVSYEVLNMSLAELESRHQLQLVWLTEGLSQEHRVEILAAPTASMRDAMADLMKALKLDPSISDSIKVWGVEDGRIERIYTESFPVSSIDAGVHIYSTVMPKEELEFVNAPNPPTDRKLVFVHHFHKDPDRRHGIPFSFLVIEGEKFINTKVRLQKTMGVFDKAFEEIRFAIVNADGDGDPIPLEDDSQLFRDIGVDQVLGLDHLDRSTRRVYNHQSAIFIKS